MSDDKKQLGRVQLRRGDDVDPQAEVEALRKLSEQHGVPGIDLGQICVRLDDLELLPREIAERRLILPVLVRDDRVFVAMTSPGDEKLIDELEFVTGKRVFPYVALPATLERVIAAAYDGKARNERFYVGPRCPPEVQRKMGVVAEPEDEVRPPATHNVFDAPAARVPEPRVAEAAARDELSYNDLGNTSPELSVVAEVPPPSPSTPPLSLSNKTILVVDDEADIRKILLRVLGTKGYRVLEADRGLEALRMVKAHMPDLLLLDAMLPEVHGFEIARRIKGSQKYGHIPIIMVSAVYKGPQYAEDARQSYGVDAYIEKPFRIAEIVAAVDAALSGTGVVAEAPVDAPPAKRRDPDEVSAEAEACLNAGVAAWQAGDLDLAIEHLRRGVEIDPLAFRLHFHLGLLYGKKGRVYEAIAELEAAVEQNAKHFPAVKNLAVLYQKAGFKTKAVSAWEKASQVAPDEATRATIRGHLETLR
ncbi:MAG: response regulator [Polyangiaceae bacterium]|nr:response regulator [Polyangiaceae bacterium]